jgi:hypothetical protein
MCKPLVFQSIEGWCTSLQGMPSIKSCCMSKTKAVKISSCSSCSLIRRRKIAFAVTWDPGLSPSAKPILLGFVNGISVMWCMRAKEELMKEALEPGSYNAEAGIPLICEGSTMCLEIKGSPSTVTPPYALISIALSVNSGLLFSSFFAPLAGAFSGWQCHFPAARRYRLPHPRC